MLDPCYSYYSCQGVPSSFAYFKYAPFLSTLVIFTSVRFASTNIVFESLDPVKSDFCIFVHIKFAPRMSDSARLHSGISAYINKASDRFDPLKFALARLA